MEELRYGFIGIVVEDREIVPQLQDLLSDFNTVILGRMGLPHLEEGRVSIISLIVRASTDTLGSLTGRLGSLKGITVKSGIVTAKPKKQPPPFGGHTKGVKR